VQAMLLAYLRETFGEGALRSGRGRDVNPAMLHSSMMPRDRVEMPDEPPPFLGTWPRVYTAVLVYLAALIVLFYGFTRYFS
jgi:hypothetical protein